MKKNMGSFVLLLLFKETLLSREEKEMWIFADVDILSCFFFFLMSGKLK